MNKVISTILVGMMLAVSLPLTRSAQAAPANVLLNPGFETAGATSTTAANWTAYGRGYTLGSTHKEGARSLKLKNYTTSQMAGAYQRIDLDQTSVTPVFIGGYVYGSGITMAPGSYFGASLYAEIHLTDGSVAYWNSVANSGSFGWRWIGFNTGTVTTVNKPIDYVFLIPMLANAQGTAYFDGLTVAQHLPVQGAVTVMFDDGEATTYTKAKPIMDQLRMPGSAAVISEMVDESGFMTVSQLKKLETSGWDIVSHSVTHNDLTTLSTTDALSELRDSKSALVGMGLSTVKNFALPYGAYNANILAQGSKYYTSVRAFEQGDNPQGAFPFEVKVRGVVNTTTSSQIADWLSQAASQKRWTILVFHSIAATGDDAYHTSPAAFQAMMNQVAASGLKVVTYNQGLTQFGATK